jgi:hypothetical protein
MSSLTLCHGHNKRHVQTSDDSNGSISLLLNNIVTTRAAQQMSVEYLINFQDSMLKNKTFPNTSKKKIHFPLQNFVLWGKISTF